MILRFWYFLVLEKWMLKIKIWIKMYKMSFGGSVSFMRCSFMLMLFWLVVLKVNIRKFYIFIFLLSFIYKRVFIYVYVNCECRYLWSLKRVLDFWEILLYVVGNCFVWVLGIGFIFFVKELNVFKLWVIRLVFWVCKLEF